MPSILLAVADGGVAWSEPRAEGPSIEAGRAIVDDVAYEMDDSRRECPIERERPRDEALEGESKEALVLRLGEVAWVRTA